MPTVTRRRAALYSEKKRLMGSDAKLHRESLNTNDSMVATEKMHRVGPPGMFH